MNLQQSYVSTKDAPAAIGPYSQAVIAGNQVFTSGQLPMEPTTGEIVSEDIEEQTRQALTNLQAILSAAGSSLEKVIKTTVFINDMNQFAKINGVYQTFFPGKAPARSCVEVACLPKNAGIEIEAIALR